jgi:hypothetical protein
MCLAAREDTGMRRAPNPGLRHSRSPMTGQGRPQFGALRRLRSVAACLALACAIIAPVDACAADLDIRLRLAWGGGDSSVWEGTIHLSAGTLSEVTALGLEADDPGSMQPIEGGGVRIFPRSPRSYDGCDLRVQAPADAKLLVAIAPESSAAAEPLEIPLAQVLRGVAQFPLDERQNRLLVQRSPGDGLRVSLARDHLVFEPGEKLELEVAANPVDVAAGSTYLLAASLLAGRSERQIWSEDLELKSDAGGTPAPVSVAVPLPMDEGVYDVRLAIFPKRLTTTLVRGKPLFSRKVQVVVVAPVKRIDPQPVAWQSVLEIDPANPKWWERMARLPSSLRLPNLPPQPVGSGPAKTRTSLERTWVELPPSGWQAYPLTVETPGLPHILEIEYPSDVEQTLAISIVEPNAAGQVAPIGLDSGIDVPPPAPGHEPAVKRHRLIVWPATRSPLVLIVNRKADRPAVFGRFNILAGPAELPAMSLPQSRSPGRTLAAYYDKPLLAENFSATRSVDPITGRCLCDWQTFLDAGRRMIETLGHSGHNAAVITVACEGSAIYPSRLLEPTPKHDNGLFFENGQDPLRKDVLELLFRLCDRAGIQLIPAVQFAAPLAQLEAQRLAGGADAVGLEPLGPDGRTWLERNGARRGMGVYYNALDPRVQAAMTAVVSELAERYGHHASFGGVSVQLGAESFALLPDETCSVDPATFEQFAQGAGIELPEAAGQSLAARAEFLHGAGEEAWLAWRAERISALYRQMQNAVTRERGSARLYLPTGDLLAGRQVQLALRPALPPKSDPGLVLRLMGLDVAQLAEAGIVVPRPHRIVPSPLPMHDFHQHWNQAALFDTVFPQSAPRAALHLLEPAPLRLPEFDAVSPFGPAKTHTWLVSQIPPAGDAYRERFARSLARLDASLVCDGGWLLPLGQEAELRPLAEVYRRLPAEPFADVPAKVGGPMASEVVVRTLHRGGKTIFYAVNAAPWPVELTLEFSSPETVRVLPYSDRPAKLDQPGPHGTWTASLAPFDLVGGEFDTQRVTFAGYEATPPADATDHLRDQVRAVRLRANSLRSPVPVKVLENPSFETAAEPATVPGWVHAGGPGIQVEVRRGAGHRSPAALRVVSKAAEDGTAPVVWVRSNPFTAPTSGRLSLLAWVRTNDPTRQPKLRLAVEGKLDGRVKYWKANVGASEDGQPVKPLTVEWSAFRFPVIDLPQAGLTDLRVGFDLMGEGEVWIDEVQVFDLWFEENERDQLLKSIATADLQASSGNLIECQEFLTSYWPSFLRRHIHLPEAPATASSASPPSATAAAKPSPAKKLPPPPSMSDRVKSWILPKSWR